MRNKSVWTGWEFWGLLCLLVIWATNHLLGSGGIISSGKTLNQLSDGAALVALAAIFITSFAFAWLVWSFLNLHLWLKTRRRERKKT